MLDITQVTEGQVVLTGETDVIARVCECRHDHLWYHYIGDLTAAHIMLKYNAVTDAEIQQAERISDEDGDYARCCSATLSSAIECQRDPVKADEARGMRLAEREQVEREGGEG